MASIYKKCILIVTSILVTIIFGISNLVIFSDGTKYTDLHTKCKTFPPGIPEVDADKIISSQWHWTYQKNNNYNNITYQISIEQKCPTLTHDANIYMNEELVSRTDGKIITTTSTVNINDCHGDTFFIFKASDIGQVILNKNKIFVNKQVEDLNKNILGYVKGEHFFANNEISIIDPYGNTIADISRNKLSFNWVWKFKIYNYTSPVSDLRLLASIAGKQAFGEDDDTTDVCNNYFWYLSFMLIAIVLFVFIGIGYNIIIFCKDSEKKTIINISDQTLL